MCPAEICCLDRGGGVVEKMIRRQLMIFGDCSMPWVIRIAWLQKEGAVASPLLQNNLNSNHFWLERIGQRKPTPQIFYALTVAGHGIICDVEQGIVVNAGEAGCTWELLWTVF